MSKKVTIIKREKKDFYCSRCGQMVDVSKAKPHTYTLDDEIIKMWDYGHMHQKVWKIQAGKHIQIK